GPRRAGACGAARPGALAHVVRSGGQRRRLLTGLGQLRRGGDVERERHLPLVDRGDLRGVHEAMPALRAADHQSLEDVYVGVSEDVGHLPHVLAVTRADRRAGLEDLPRDRRARLHGRYTRWISVPVPRPPPQHMVTSPHSWSERSSSCRRVVMSRAPVEPSGWPSAMAPPLTLTRSMSELSSRCQAATTGANASLISTRS